MVVPGTLVQGTVYIDLDADGVRDDDDPGQAKVTIFADTNNNGLRDVSEPFAISDFEGKFTLATEDGTHIIRAEPPSGLAQTAPHDPSVYTVTVVGDDAIRDLDFGFELLVGL